MAPFNISLPTLDRTGGQVETDIDVQKVASDWFSSFAGVIEKGNIAAIADHFIEDCAWRDLLALTWDFRSILGITGIKRLLEERLQGSKLSLLKHQSDAVLEEVLPNYVFIRSSFSFETEVGIGKGVFRLVPLAGGIWKAHIISTALDGLKGFPEKVGALVDHSVEGILKESWDKKRRHDAEFTDGDPKVIIVGAGHNGLETAARLEVLGIPALVLEREERIGDVWRKRYDSLSLHDPSYFNHMPYLPFPPSWPIYIPAQKLATWLESYANSLELNVWTSTTVRKATYDESTGRWTVEVIRGDASRRALQPNHLVFALGSASDPIMPEIPGTDDFTGKILHSSLFKTGKEFVGRKVLVVGSGTSGHDIAADLYRHGADVTMLQRSSTHVVSGVEGAAMYIGSDYRKGVPLDVADMAGTSFPLGVAKHIHKVIAPLAMPKKEIMNGLKRAGFEANELAEGFGLSHLYCCKCGGYYLDTGTSQLIAEGKIKIKHGVEIAKLNSNEATFTDGKKLQVDAIILCTGYENPRDLVCKMIGDAVADKLGPVWGLDEEDELQSVWRGSGHERLWFALGGLSMGRIYSKYLALQIKAIEENLFGTRYSLQN